MLRSTFYAVQVRAPCYALTITFLNNPVKLHTRCSFCIQISSGQQCIVMEYAELGDLLSFIQNEYTCPLQPLQYVSVGSDGLLSEAQTPRIEDNATIMMFAWQIAKGMRHLEMHRVSGFLFYLPLLLICYLCSRLLLFDPTTIIIHAPNKTWNKCISSVKYL